MKLESYFSQLQKQSLSEHQKSTIYESILRKTQPTKPMFSRMRFYAKLAGYALFLGLLGFSIYVPFLSQQTDHSNIAVHADFIAKVVDIKGQYYIESNGQRIEGSNISDGNTIVLASDSSLIVHVGDHIEGKITGPATFTVDRKGDGYGITLKQGDYVEIATLGDQKDSPTLALVSESHKFIAQTHAGKLFHFVLAEKDNKPLLTNKADDALTIINESAKDQEDKTVELALNNTVSIGDQYIFTSIASPTQVASIIALKTNTETAASTDYNNGFFRGMLLAQDTATDISSPTNASASKTMKIAASAAEEEGISYDAKTVRSNLLPQFVWVDVKYITYHYLNGEQAEYEIAYANFLNRLYNIYDALNLSIPSDGILATQKDSYSLDKLSILASYLDQNLPPKLLAYQSKAMHTIVLFLDKLKKHPFGEFKDQGFSLDDLFDKMQ